MVFPIAGGNESKGYDISNSLRFNNDDSPKLTFTPSSAGNRRTFTLSVWFKLSVYSTGERVLLAADDGTGSNNNFDYIDRRHKTTTDIFLLIFHRHFLINFARTNNKHHTRHIPL